ncbi:alcohol dehydrogenase iron-type [Bifidobacterium lemurum]|uniref:Alcohol dehydrogenase iron-type n=1 Tax=Bifidobacterium lemurum TaxID=1603886 RepID=A0A261FMP7_9BIFI|nr:iron-containing alcohol dehydrogenase [Bifidobacterium lemurum]OZG60255.1 alcohol dehydrogenase iron-type [Bifidobacterium lemurum]QOL34147.1 iron-containing alcohol dehydrogenase [Bifidobacterium lemurum]
MNTYETLRTPHTVFGDGSLDTIGRHLTVWGARSCLLVTDKGIVGLGYAERAKQSVEQAGISCDVYDQCLPDPPDTTCLEVRDLILEGNYDAVIGLGGGSSMDTAKVAALIAGIPEDIDDLHEYSKQGSRMSETYRRPCRLITIPTTGGSGAESTPTGVITSTSLNLKFSIGNENLIADLAIIDPTLTVGMPPTPTAYCGLDALAHCMENLIGTQQNAFSELVQLDCLERIWTWLPVAFREPENLEAREHLAWAAHYAEASGAVPNGHAVAHAIGAMYHIVHGHACAMTLPTVYRHFAQAPEAADAIHKVGQRIGVAVSDDPIANGDRVADAILTFYRGFGLSGLQETLRNNGTLDTRDEFIAKAVPLVMDDFKSRLWTPAIHTGDYASKIGAVLGAIWDER